MGKTIEKGFAKEDDLLCGKIVIGPIRIYRPSAKDGEPESKDDEWSEFPEVPPTSNDENATS
jgi:hypothetical protein